VRRAGWIGAGALILFLPWNEAGDHPTGLALAHLLALAAILCLPCAGRARLAGGIGISWLAAFLVWGALGALRPGHRFSSILELWDQLVPALWLVAMAHAPLAAPARRRLAALVAASAALHALWVLWLRAALGARTGGAFVNANFMAAHLNVAWPAALWLLWQARGKVRTLLTATLLVMAAALFASGSRGALLGALAAAALFVPWSGLGAGFAARSRRAALAATLVVAGLAAGAALWIRSGNLQADPYRFDRLRIWGATASIWGAHPWVGVGPGQLQWIAPAHKFPLQNQPFRYSRLWTSAHSTPLQLVAEEGLLGLLMAGAFVLCLTRALASRSRMMGGDAARAALAALAAVAVQGLVDTPLENTAVTLALATLVGLALGPQLPGAPAVESRRGGQARPFARRIGLAGAAALAAGLWGAVVAPWVAHRAIQRFQAESEPRRALAHLERALRWNPYQHAYQFQLGRIIWTARGRLDRRRVAAAERVLARASRLNPHDGRADLERGRLLAQAAADGVMPSESALRAALRRYEEAARRRPLDAPSRKEAGIAALRLGDPGRARAEAVAALELEPNFLDAHLLLADAELRAGNAAPARAALDAFRQARARLASYAAANEYEELMLKYNDAVSARLERETGG